MTTACQPPSDSLSFVCVSEGGGERGRRWTSQMQMGSWTHQQHFPSLANHGCPCSAGCEQDCGVDQLTGRVGREAGRWYVTGRGWLGAYGVVGRAHASAHPRQTEQQMRARRPARGLRRVLGPRRGGAAVSWLTPCGCCVSTRPHTRRLGRRSRTLAICASPKWAAAGGKAGAWRRVCIHAVCMHTRSAA